MRRRTRRDRAAMKLASASGADCTDRVPLKWISPSHTPSRPQASAAATSSTVSRNVVASLAPARRSSRKTPTCIWSPSAPGAATRAHGAPTNRALEGDGRPLGEAPLAAVEATGSRGAVRAIPHLTRRPYPTPPGMQCQRFVACSWLRRQSSTHRRLPSRGGKDREDVATLQPVSYSSLTLLRPGVPSAAPTARPDLTRHRQRG